MIVPRILFGLVALVPAGLNSGIAVAAPMAVALCSDGATARALVLPLAPATPRDPANCCAKGCHAGGARKRKSCQY